MYVYMSYLLPVFTKSRVHSQHTGADCDTTAGKDCCRATRYACASGSFSLYGRLTYIVWYICTQNKSKIVGIS